MTREKIDRSVECGSIVFGRSRSFTLRLRYNWVVGLDNQMDWKRKSVEWLTSHLFRCVP